MLYIIEDKFRNGSFCDQSASASNNVTPTDAAITYVSSMGEADEKIFAFPVIVKGNAKSGNGFRLFVGLFSTLQVLRGIEKFNNGEKTVLNIRNNVLKVTAFEKMRMIQTFGAPLNLIEIEGSQTLTGVKAMYNNAGKGWELTVQDAFSKKGLKSHYIGSLRKGKNDLQQAGDHYIETDTPVSMW